MTKTEIVARRRARALPATITLPTATLQAAPSRGPLVHVPCILRVIPPILRRRRALLVALPLAPLLVFPPQRLLVLVAALARSMRRLP